MAARPANNKLAKQNGRESMEQACLVILAGGKGTRLGGRDKAWLEIGGRPLVERILSALGPLFAQRVVVRGAGSAVEVAGQPLASVPQASLARVQTTGRLPENPEGPGRPVEENAGHRAGRLPNAGGPASEPGGEAGAGLAGEVEFTADLFPGYGPLAGIHAGLLKSRYLYNLVVACDMPFTDPRLAAYLLEQARGYDVAVPRIGGLLEPLFAVYSRNCLGPVQRSLEAGKRRTFDLYSQVRVRYVEEEEINRVTSWVAVFFNVNTPEELEKARAMASPRQEKGD
ncbi:MAG: molybdenum cofactor guanylyltransferase [Clostridia bacterium]|nr:MAG: molybdenum cofactor guanylyltransferase [Clostridia bacterium]